MSGPFEYYIKQLGKLRSDAGKDKYPPATLHRAPHKPLLLLAILDLFDQGELTTNFVPLSSELAELFSAYWELVMLTDRVGRLYMPFFHLKNDGFWHLIAHPGQEGALAAIQQVGGTKQLQDTVLGGSFDDALFELIIDPDTRTLIRGTLIETYFHENARGLLLEQSTLNSESYHYSLALLDQARSGTVLTENNVAPLERPVRDQGFRKAIVRAYDHRCVLCGVRLVIEDGRSAATAAHIIPWRLSHNDDPRNGLCLCPLCHWTFDAGLSSITTRYRIRLSGQLGSYGNRPGLLSTLEDRPIFEPLEENFSPDVEALKWHSKEVFLG
jgi:putative restriction endonuclease